MSNTPRASTRLSMRDETKPLVLIAAVVAGIALNHLAGGRISGGTWLVNAGLFGVVFTIMAFVEIHNVGRAFRKVKPTLLAIATNYVFVPLFAWTLGWLFLRGEPDLWAGVILYALTPCIGWYLIFIDLAGGDLPWGLALLPIDITLQVVLLPLYLWLFVGKVVPIDVTAILGSVGLFLVAPFAAATLTRLALTRWRGRDWTYDRYQHLIGEAKLWALVAVIVAIFATQAKLDNGQLVHVGLIIGAITTFFLGLFVAALGLGRTFRLGYRVTTTLVFEVTARNSESVIGVAAVILPGRPLVILAILIGPVIELPVLLGLTRVMLYLRTRWSWPDHSELDLAENGGFVDASTV